MSETSGLTMSHIVGFNGKLQGGVVTHPDSERIIYAVGGSLVVRGLDRNSPQRLMIRGAVTAEESDIVVWDVESLRPVHTLSLHTGNVASMSFSPDERFLVSLGGDDNRIAVWDAENGRPVCGAPASKEREGKARVVACLPGDRLSFLSCGEGTMRVWVFDEGQQRVEPLEVAMGIAVKRVVTCAAVAASGSIMYCGTTSGDILEIDVVHRVFKTSGPLDKKDVPLIEQGVLNIAVCGEILIVGSGSGIVYKVDPSNWTLKKKVQLDGSGTSVCSMPLGGFVYGTSLNKLYYIDKDLSSQLLHSAPYGAVNDLTFAYDYSDLFVACSANTISVWNSATSEELLHIEEPNKTLVCNCVVVPHDGKSIISGWSDGRIRAYTPETGKFLWMIENVHHGAVTAIALFDNGTHMVTGGSDAEVRLWRMGTESRTMEANMKEHRGGITNIVLNRDNTRALSSSSDGTCLIWDLGRKCSMKAFFGSASVSAAVWDETETQVIAVGAEKKVAVYEAVSGARIKEYSAATLGLTALAAAPGTGGNIAIGSADLSVKIWSSSGELVAEGQGHSGPVTKIRFAPNGHFLVSSGDNGAIYIWTI
eukprot:m51a1_g3908 hypothetical protein (592) ;mRNA; f:130886-133099